MDCSKEKLDEFSNKHYTYINQIFGDLTVREIISEVFPSSYIFQFEETGAEFENSFHHTVQHKLTGEPICSVKDQLQNININKNDTLCQSYSLLAFFNIIISKDPIRRQMEMVNMYRMMLKNEKFIEALDDIINTRNNKHWVDFTNTGKRKKYLKMDKKEIIRKIHEVLDDWEKFGFWFFIREGQCPNKKWANYFTKNKLKLTRKKITTRKMLTKLNIPTFKKRGQKTAKAVAAAAPAPSSWETVNSDETSSSSRLPSSLLSAMRSTGSTVLSQASKLPSSLLSAMRSSSNSNVLANAPNLPSSLISAMKVPKKVESWETISRASNAPKSTPTSWETVLSPTILPQRNLTLKMPIKRVKVNKSRRTMAAK